MLEKKYILIGVGGIVGLLLIIVLLTSGGGNKTKTVNTSKTGKDFETEVIDEAEPTVKVEVTQIPTLALTPVPTINQEIGGGVAVATAAPTIAPTLTPVPTIAPTRVPTQIPTQTPVPTQMPNIVEATGVTLGAVKVDLYLNEKQKILSRVEPNETTNKTVTWSSSDSNVAMVDNDGLITAVNLGKATLTARTSNNKTNTVQVEVKDKATVEVPQNIEAEKITLNIAEVLLNKGRTQQINVTFTPNATTNKSVSWSSDNNSVATVDGNGLVTAVNFGTATIIGRTNNGKTSSAKVTVLGAVSGSNPTLAPTVKPTATIPTVVTPTVSKPLWTFVYDENDTKPKMECKTYTEADRSRLEALLRQAVDKVGRGTRAGVVEAARFLSGGLSYKVPYLGPKKVDSTLGKYKKEGLNIGNSKGWGCHISGWTQGMDCTNFVEWAIINGGLTWNTVDPQSKAMPFAQNVSKVKVGDFLLTLSNGVVDWTYSHTSIIIGIDDNYFYVAEARGSGTIVSKISKKSLPSKNDRLGMVSLGKYPAEGNVTNMWNR